MPAGCFRRLGMIYVKKQEDTSSDLRCFPFDYLSNAVFQAGPVQFSGHFEHFHSDVNIQIFRLDRDTPPAIIHFKSSNALRNRTDLFFKLSVLISYQLTSGPVSRRLVSFALRSGWVPEFQLSFPLASNGHYPYKYVVLFPSPSSLQ